MHTAGAQRMYSHTHTHARLDACMRCQSNKVTDSITASSLSECILRKQLRFPEIAVTHPPGAFCAVYGRA
jgi:hypothetical protein